LWSFLKQRVFNILLQGLAGVESGICKVTANIGADVYRWAEQNFLLPGLHVTEVHDGLTEGVLKHG
jgi:hypothetical protein